MAVVPLRTISNFQGTQPFKLQRSLESNEEIKYPLENQFQLHLMVSCFLGL